MIEPIQHFYLKYSVHSSLYEMQTKDKWDINPLRSLSISAQFISPEVLWRLLKSDKKEENLVEI